MKKVFASREGLIGGLTSAGLTIRENSLFVALPSTRALWHCVRVKFGEKSFVVAVLDVGPWFPFAHYPNDEEYVFGDDDPRAEEMRGYERVGDVHHYKINGAGIDLSDALIEKFGFKPEQWGLREIEWEFIE